jgi:hypothetical protein
VPDRRRSEKIVALPHPTWPKRECLMQTAHRFAYDRSFRAAGMTIVNIDTREAFASAISDRTAMIGVLGMVERDPQPAVMQPKELIDIGRRAGCRCWLTQPVNCPPRIV